MAASVSPARKELQKRSNLAILLAILSQGAYTLISINMSGGVVANTNGVVIDVFSIFVGIVSLGLWIAAVSYFAQSKGYWCRRNP